MESVARSCQPWWCSDQEIGTPVDLFEELNAEFHFDLDVCASESNKKVPRFYSEVNNGLAQPWSGSVFCNPPYGKIQPWVDKGLYEIDHCKVIVYLLPSRTSRPWFRSLMKEGEVRFLDHRIRFEGTKAKAQFDCLIGILMPQTREVSDK
jgi:phage N-6-adenine-methyltransferase